jgi:hypothetical protein
MDDPNLPQSGDALNLDAGMPQPHLPTVPAPTPVDNWQTRFAGLQRSVQDVLQKSGFQRFGDIPSRADVDGLRAEAQRAATLAADVERVSAERGAYEAQVAALTAQLNGAQAQNTVFQVLAEVAPELVPFASYLPQAGTRDEIVAQIETFRGKLKTVGVTPSQPFSPLPPASSPPAGVQNNLGDLQRQYREAQAAKNFPEMQRLASEILPLTTK